jgi:hypothetical protein
MEATHRKKCFAVKERKCAVCDYDGDVIVHHADGDKTNDKISNLVPLCKSCHRKVHNGSRENPELRSLVLRVERGLNEDKIGESIDPRDYTDVPSSAYITVKETKPGYKYYYWQWRDGDSHGNMYIAPVRESEPVTTRDTDTKQTQIVSWSD